MLESTLSFEFFLPDQHAAALSDCWDRQQPSCLHLSVQGSPQYSNVVEGQ